MDRVLRRRCMAIIRSLDIPDPWDLTEFLARLAYRRGRALLLMPPIVHSPGAPCGMCVSAADADYIFVVEGTSRLHRDHIVLHETGHLLLGHQSGLDANELADLLMPDLTPALILRVIGRIAYDTVDEQEAEYFATALLHQAARRHAARTVDPDVAHVVARLDGTWGRPSRNPGSGK